MRWLAGLWMAVAVSTAVADDARAAGPAPVERDVVLRDFRFHTGEVLPEVKLHVTTLGEPSGIAVLILHGTAGSGATMLGAGFGGLLFGPGQVLDAARHYIIVPDALGTGQSTRPSDGLRARFPRYNYDDMVLAQYRLLTEGLGVTHLRVIIGNSMGGMNTWVWGVTYPGFADALVPMAAQPSAMAARNWMMRRMMIEAIRRDPGYQGGNYTTQPASIGLANVFYGIATNGGTLAYQAMAPSAALADKAVEERLAVPFTMDANDFIWQWEAARDYDPAPKLSRITAAVLAINSADDERNPPQTGLTEKAVASLPHGRLLVIPESAETRGHGTTAMAKFWKAEFAAWLAGVPVGK